MSSSISIRTVYRISSSNSRGRLFEGGDYFKHFHQRGAIIQGRRLIERWLLFKEIYGILQVRAILQMKATESELLRSADAFLSDTSPKYSDREGLGRRLLGTRQGVRQGGA